MTEPSDRLRMLFDAALAHTGTDRDAFVRESCADDSLRIELDRLLAAHDRAGSFLDGSALASFGEDLTAWAGRRLGVYEIAHEIGRGGMGVVFLATRVDELFRKQVAIKVLRSNLDGRELLDRFRRERQILASLDHPNIARLIDGGTTEEGLPYVVMDYVEGQPIDTFCRDQHLSIEKRLQLFQTLCSAVHYAHQNLVVHRDLKPSNIVVTRDGQPKLLDFGIAKLLQSDLPGETRTGLRPMTLDYASPEQITGEVITTASDVYALGVVLYQLVSGERPYPRNSHSEHDMMRHICDHMPEAPSKAIRDQTDSDGSIRKLRRQLAGDIDTIVLKALRKEPSRRYSSAEQLSDDITRYLTGLPVLAQNDTVTYRTAKFVRRHTIAVAATALIIMAFFGGVVAIAREARIAERERQLADAQRARAERRFNDVRRLASSFLFEFHDAIAHLPGSTPARKLVVSKALEYLGSLNPKPAATSPFNRNWPLRTTESVTCSEIPHWPTSEIRLAQFPRTAKPSRSGKGSPRKIQRLPGARSSVMRKLAAPNSRPAIWRAHFRISGKRWRCGSNGFGVEPHNADVAQRVAEMAARLCTGLVLLGDTPGALANCRRCDALTNTLLEAHPADVALRTQKAVNMIALGNALRLSGQPKEAADTLQTAVNQFRPLMAVDSTNADLQRRAAIAHAYLANAELDLHDRTAATENYRAAIGLLQGLVSADPSNVRFRTDLTYMLFRQGGLLTQAGRTQEARASTKRGLAFLRLSAERSTASAEDLNDYAWWLATGQPADLRQPTHAIELAKRAIALAHSPNASYLHTLGWSYFRAGDRPDAVDALQRALAILEPGPPGAPSTGLRRQVEVDLLEFRHGHLSREISRPPRVIGSTNRY